MAEIYYQIICVISGNGKTSTGMGTGRSPIWALKYVSIRRSVTKTDRLPAVVPIVVPL